MLFNKRFFLKEVCVGGGSQSYSLRGFCIRLYVFKKIDCVPTEHRYAFARYSLSYISVVNYGESSNVTRGPCPSLSGRCRRDFGERVEATKMQNNVLMYSFVHQWPCKVHRSKGIVSRKQIIGK